jgi:hypothetical protein
VIAAEQSDGQVVLVLGAIFATVVVVRWVWMVALPAMALALLRRWYAAKGRTRLGIVVTPIALGWAWLEAKLLLYVLAPIAFFLTARTLYRYWVWRPHFIVHIAPVHKVVAPVLGYPLEMNPEHYLDIPIGLLDGEGAITVTLPDGYWPTERDKGEIVTRITTTLNLKDVRTDWRLNGINRHLHICRRDRSVPEVVEFDEAFRELLEAAPAHRKLVGYTTGDKPFYLDFLDENPHVLLSCLTGWGKTTALGIMLADELHKGGEVALLDIKFGSMRWAYGLPGVTYARTVEVIHDTLMKIGRELGKRREKLGETEYTKDPSFTRLFIVIEEINALIEELRDYWTERRAEIKAECKEAGVPFTEPLKSPAIKAYKQVLLMGRQLGINLVAIAQRAEANDVGGSVPRSQMGTVVMGWADPATWAMLAKQHAYHSHNGRRGHAYVSRGKFLAEVQFVKASPHELREWANSGKEPATALSQASQGKSDPSHLGASRPGVLGQPVLTLVHDEDPGPAGVTLRAMSSDYGEDGGLVPEKLTSLQKESRRDALFPRPLGDADASGAFRYDAEQVIAWSSNRPVNARRQRRSG